MLPEVPSDATETTTVPDVPVDPTFGRADSSGVCPAASYKRVQLGHKNWKLEWGDVIRDPDSLVEMEVSIGGKGYVFRG